MAIKDVVLGYAKGDKGDRGPQGEKGATGAIGPKGDPGNIADAQITDTEGLDVAKGQKTTAQKLFDAIANRIVTKLVTNDALTKKLADYMLKGMMSNTNVNNTGTVPTSALMYSMFEQINNNMSKFDVYHRDVTGSLNDDKIIQTALEDFKTSIVTNKPILVEIQNHLGGRALAVGIQSLSNYNSFLVITYYDRPKEFVYSMNQWQVRRLVAPLGMEYGTTDMNRTPGQVTTKHITFQNRLSAFPKVFVCPHTKSPDDTTVSASEATYDGFDVYCYSKAAKEPLAISWMAWY